jgi:hypothetical protein
VQNGQVILDEAVELVDGTDLEVLVPEEEDMSEDERVELEAALAESAEQFERGEFVEARPAILRLLARA